MIKKSSESLNPAETQDHVDCTSPGDGSCTTDPCWYYVANVTNTPAVTLQLLNGTGMISIFANRILG